MRLIDADKLIEELTIKAVSKDAHIISIANAVVNLVNNQPTAYDIDKVVEELEEVKMRYFLTIANTGDEKSDFAYENVGNALDEAIEIVKQGGVSDDVCEWEKDEHSENDNPAEWIICPHKPKRIFSKDIKYCPYCGKKIKVVE